MANFRKVHVKVMVNAKQEIREETRGSGRQISSMNVKKQTVTIFVCVRNMILQGLPWEDRQRSWNQ